MVVFLNAILVDGFELALIDWVHVVVNNVANHMMNPRMNRVVNHLTIHIMNT